MSAEILIKMYLPRAFLGRHITLGTSAFLKKQSSKQAKVCIA
jgi:hypothetical protein